MSFRTVNVVARFLIFLALSESDGNCPSLRYDRIGVVQLMLPCIKNVWNSSMLGNFCISSIRPDKLVLKSDDAYLPTSFASEF